MKVSTKGQYGIRAMFDLATYYGKGPVPISKIAAHQGVSIAYLEQLFSVLRKAGVIESVRGAQGGFTLTKRPEEITLGDILIPLEGQLAPVKCVSHNEECESISKCPSWIIWKKLNDRINGVLDSITLGDILNEYEAAEKSAAETRK